MSETPVPGADGATRAGTTGTLASGLSGLTGPPAEDATAVLRGKRVLVVDDNPINLRYLSHLLGQFGMVVQTAGDGAQALARAADQVFDLVLMDVSMPVMNGLDATRALRARAVPGAPRLPVIGVSAHTVFGDREQCLAAGMSDYVGKPVQRALLIAAMLQQLDGLPACAGSANLSGATDSA